MKTGSPEAMRSEPPLDPPEDEETCSHKWQQIYGFRLRCVHCKKTLTQDPD